MRVRALFAVSVAVCSVGLFVLYRVLETTRGNFAAVVRSCEILNGKIVESQLPPPPDSSTAILLGEIVRGMAPGTRRRFLAAIEREKKVPRLGEVACETEARKARGDP